jgi:hypothetical protein
VARPIYTNLRYRCATMAIPLDTFEPECDISFSTPAKPLARFSGHAQSWRVFHFPLHCSDAHEIHQALPHLLRASRSPDPSGLEATREEIIERLKTGSYYRLSAYWYPFRQPDDSLLPGTTLAVIWRRYTLRHARLPEAHHSSSFPVDTPRLPERYRLTRQRANSHNIRSPSRIGPRSRTHWPA